MVKIAAAVPVASEALNNGEVRSSGRRSFRNDSSNDSSPNGDFLINGQRVQDIPLATVMYVSPPPLEATAIPAVAIPSSTSTTCMRHVGSDLEQQNDRESSLNGDALYYDHAHELFDGGDNYFDEEEDVIRSTTSEPLPPPPPSFNPDYDAAGEAEAQHKLPTERKKKKKPTRRRSTSPVPSRHRSSHNRTNSPPSAPHHPPHKPTERRQSLKDVQVQSQKAWGSTVEKAKQFDEQYKLREKSEWMLEKTKTAAIATTQSLKQFNKEYKPVKKAQNAVMWATSSRSVSSSNSVYTCSSNKSKDRKKKKKKDGANEENFFNPAHKIDNGNTIFDASLSKDFR